MHYVQATRETYKKDHPELSHKETIAKLGEVWNNLDEKEKGPFHAKATIDKDKYKREKDEYLANKLKAAPPAPVKKKGKEDEPATEKKVKKV